MRSKQRVNLLEVRASLYKSLCNSSEVQRLGFVNEPVNPILVGGERGDLTGLKKKCFVGLFFLEDIDPVRGFLRRALRANFPEEVTTFQ